MKKKKNSEYYCQGGRTRSAETSFKLAMLKGNHDKRNTLKTWARAMRKAKNTYDETDL